MTAIADPAPESGEDSLNGVRAVVLIGCVMVGVYLLSSVLQVYERDLLNTLFPYSSQFAFLRGLFPSPWSDDLVDWQNVALFEVVPFLLFLLLAVRMRIDLMGRVLPMVTAMVVLGIGLSFFNLVLGVYQNNISSLLLNGSFTIPNMSQTNPLAGILSLISSTWELGYIFESGVVFAALGMTGIASEVSRERRRTGFSNPGSHRVARRRKRSQSLMTRTRPSRRPPTRQKSASTEQLQLLNVD